MAVPLDCKTVEKLVKQSVIKTGFLTGFDWESSSVLKLVVKLDD